MKKLIAGLFTALALTLGLVTVSGTAPASAYGPTGPTASIVKHDVQKAIKKVKKHHKRLSFKKAYKLKKEVRKAYKAGLISKKLKVKLIHKILKNQK